MRFVRRSGERCHVAEAWPAKARPTGAGVWWLAFAAVTAPLFLPTVKYLRRSCLLIAAQVATVNSAGREWHSG